MIQFLDGRIKVLYIFFIVMYVFAFIGCRTLPDFVEDNYPGLIAYEGSLLVHFNLAKDTVLLDNFLSRYSSSNLSPITNRTERVSISIDTLKSDSKFSIIAEGSYSKTITNFAIGKEDQWIKHKDNYVWWENQLNGLYISVPKNSVAIISNYALDSKLLSIELGSRKYIPEDVRAAFTQEAVTVYSHIPNSKLFEAFHIPAKKMTVQELFFIIKNNSDNYKISGILEFLNEADAKNFSRVLKLGLVIKLRGSGKAALMEMVHSSSIEVVERSIIVDNIILDYEELTKLIY